MMYNATSTYYVEDNEFRKYPFPHRYGVDRFINLAMQTYKDGTASYRVAFNHRCLDWGHCRSYEISADQFSDLVLSLTTKYGLKSVSPFAEGSYSDKYASQITFYFELSELRHSVGYGNTLDAIKAAQQI